MENDEMQVVETPEPETPEANEEYGEPRGAYTFVMLMLVMYLGYWFLTWFEIFVPRGA